MPGGRARRQEDGPQVDGQDKVPLLVRHIVQHRVAIDPRVVDEHVETPQRRDGRVDEPLGLVRLHEVDDELLAAPSIGRHEVRRLAQQLLRHVADKQIRPLRGQRDGDAAAEAAPRAGDERRLVR